MASFDFARIWLPCDVRFMLLHDAAAEIPFEASFDGTFPYEDGPKASALIEQGWAISLNAAFCVLYEICLLPSPEEDVSRERRHELVREWAAGPEHPLKAPLLRCAAALINCACLPWQEGIDLMRRVGEYPGQRAALGIAYFASDSESCEGDRALTVVDNEVRQGWDQQGI